MNVDPTGHFFLALLTAFVLLCTPVGGVAFQTAVSVISYVGFAIASIFNEDIRNDMNAIGWNPFNADAFTTASSKVVSFYKGVPIIRTDKDSMSLGVIFLTTSDQKGSSGFFWKQEDILKHEWGHVIQQLAYGPLSYIVNIGVPSAFIENLDDSPWEITADIFGQVDRSLNLKDVLNGVGYFLFSKILGSFWFWK